MTAALQSSVPVTAMELPWTPGAERAIVVPEGLSVAEIVARAFPGAPADILARIRVVMSRDGRHAIVRRRGWARTYPHGGTSVVLQLGAGKGLRSILQILVSVAAFALANALAPGLGTMLGVSELFAKGLITLGVTALGGILLNALFRSEKKDEDKAVLAATGWRNAFSPDGPVPVLFGELRVAPPFAAASYVEIVGDRVHLRGAFDWGVGPIEIDPRKIGDTPATDFPEYSDLTVTGLPDDPPMRYYPRQVLTEEVGVDLVREWPRDEDGTVRYDLPQEPSPVARRSAYDATRIVNIIALPEGLGLVNDKGKKFAGEVVFSRRMRLVGEEEWTELDDLPIRRKRFAGFYVADIIDPPQRGRWEVEYERQTTSEPVDNDTNGYFYATQWMQMQSFRPEYPIVIDVPLALTSALVRSTTKMKGTIDSLNAVCRRVARDWDAGEQAWVERATRSPAAAAIFALTGPATAQAYADETIDWPAFEAWAEYTAPLGLHYDRFHQEDGEALEDALRAIGAAGRAVVWNDGYRWTVIVDRPSDLVAFHINARNASRLALQASYFRPPDAFRVKFLDRTSDYEPRVRVVPWPPDVRFELKEDMEADLDHRAGTRAEVFDDPEPQSNIHYRKVGAAGTGSWEPWPSDIVEDLDMPGITDPDTVWIETRRRQYEALHRSVVWTATVPGILTAPRIGSQGRASRDFIARTAASARVKAVRGDLVELDEAFVMEAGVAYAIRFRAGETNESIGTSIVRTIRTVAGAQNAVVLTGGSDTGDASYRPEPGQIVHFGPAGADSTLLVVTEVTRTETGDSALTMLPAAPIIDTLAAAEVPPPWNGRVGEIVDVGEDPPGVPAIVLILSGFSGTGEGGGLTVYLEPQPGESAEVAFFDVRHKLSGAGTWAGTVTAPAASGGLAIPGYEHGDEVTFQARAVSAGTAEGDWTSEISVEIGADDPPVPEALPASSIQITAKLGHAEIVFATGTDPNTTHVQIWRDDAKLGSPIPVSPGGTFGRIDGDSTRVERIVNGDMGSAAGWTLDTDVTIAAGKMVKVAGASPRYPKQALSMSDGETIRFGVVVDATNAAGATFQVRLFDGANAAVANGAQMNTTGLHYGSLAGSAAVAAIGFAATGARTFTADNLKAYVATAACPPQGDHTYELEPLNEDVPGPRSAAVTITII